MKISVIILALTIGGLTGWLLTGNQDDFSISEAARSKEPIPPQAVRSSARKEGPQDSREFLRERARLLNEGKSPYRREVLELGWLDQLPLEDVLELLRAGHLRSSEELHQAFSRWVEVEPLAALVALDELVLTRDGRRFAQGPVYAHWVRTNPLGLLEILAGLPATLERERKARLVQSAWAQENPSQALEHVDALAELFARPAERRRAVQRELLAALLDRDEDQAMAWVESSAAAEERPQLREWLQLESLRRQEKSEAIEFILKQPRGSSLHGHLASMWQEWARASPREALARMGSLPADHRFWAHDAASIAQSAYVLASLLGSSAELVSVVDAIPEGMRREQVLLGLIQGAGGKNVATAQELLARLPEGRAREKATGFLVESWARQDLEAAGEWLKKQEATRSRDVAITHYTNTLLQEDPAHAARWVDAIGDPNLRRRSRERVFARWKEKDAAAATSWKKKW